MMALTVKQTFGTINDISIRSILDDSPIYGKWYKVFTGLRAEALSSLLSVPKHIENAI